MGISICHAEHLHQVCLQLQAWQSIVESYHDRVAKADSMRTLKDAPAPGTATANSVADTIEQLKTMTGNILHDRYDKYNKDNTVSDYNTAYGATTDDSSTDTKSHKT